MFYFGYIDDRVVFVSVSCDTTIERLKTNIVPTDKERKVRGFNNIMLLDCVCAQGQAICC